MIRILAALTLLLLITGGSVLYMGYKPSYDPELLKKIQLVSEIKRVKPLALKGDTQAQYELGRLYEFGDVKTRNQALAALWYQRAAEKGHGDAQYAMGRLYDKGEGVKQDFYAAAKWYRLSATFSRNPNAQFGMAQLYFYGRGVDQDYGKAIDFYKQAAAQNHAISQYLLGAMYENSWGVKQDYIRAYIWYKLAAPKTEVISKINRRYNPVRALQSLQTKMNRYQIEEAEKQIKAMQAKR